MSPTERLLSRPATVHHRAQTGPADGYGDPTWVETTVAVLCEIQQRSRTEAVDGISDTQDERWEGWFPPGVALEATDRVTCEGVTFEVFGPPWPARNPRTGEIWYIAATLRRTV